MTVISYTVSEFAQHSKMRAARASQILRRARIEGILTMTEDAEYRSTYHGPVSAFSDIVAAEQLRLGQRAKTRAATMAKRKQAAGPVVDRPKTLTRFAGERNPWTGDMA